MYEHSKLARVVVDHAPSADKTFHIKVAKTSVGPSEVCAQSPLGDGGGQPGGQDVYRQRVRLGPQPGQEIVGDAAEPASSVVGGHWPMTMDLLAREIADLPGLWFECCSRSMRAVPCHDRPPTKRPMLRSDAPLISRVDAMEMATAEDDRSHGGQTLA